MPPFPHNLSLPPIPPPPHPIPCGWSTEWSHLPPFPHSEEQRQRAVRIAFLLLRLFPTRFNQLRKIQLRKPTESCAHSLGCGAFAGYLDHSRLPEVHTTRWGTKKVRIWCLSVVNFKQYRHRLPIFKFTISTQNTHKVTDQPLDQKQQIDFLAHNLEFYLR